MKKYLVILTLVLLFTNCNWIQENIWGSPESKLDKTIIEKAKNNLFELDGNFSSEKGIDITSSEISFEIDGLSETKGRFKSFDINIESSSKDELFNIYVTIEANSIFTANDMRDEHLLNEDFFNTQEFPTISFKSTNIIKTDSCYLAQGELSLLGNDNKFTLPFNYLGTSESTAGNNIYIFDGEIKFDRTAYGMSEAESVGNIVTLNFYTELSKK
jgi:polyisoprenoid-binding protein YceI